MLACVCMHNCSIVFYYQKTSIELLNYVGVLYILMNKLDFKQCVINKGRKMCDLV